MKLHKHTLLLAAGLGLSACGTVPPAVPVEYLDKPVFERHDIGVKERTEVLKIELDPQNTTLPGVDRRRIESFLRAYNDYGHGPLTMLLPEGSANPQNTVRAVTDARNLAFAYGVEYHEIDGGSSIATEGPAILYMSFKRFEAIAPECQSFGEVDFGATRSNNDLPTLGCSVRTNMAAMIADPSDLLGQRELEPGDAVRRQITFDQYRAGESTASERNEGESGTVSESVEGEN
ncbi:MAG: CpaD family pilus assembly protein [Pseudomonadota bacterium]